MREKNYCNIFVKRFYNLLLLKISNLIKFKDLSDLDLLHFEQLKKEVQAAYLERHSPSEEDISQWKGIDIVYFQEDLRKFAKGNISEKSFYTYFKNIPTVKLPRIDMLNLLSIYAGYASWYDFKKNHDYVEDILKQLGTSETISEHQKSELLETTLLSTEKTNPVVQENDNDKNLVLQKNNNDNQLINENKPSKNKAKSVIWIVATFILLVVLIGFIVSDRFLTKSYSFRFIDADRNTSINDYLDVKILKDGESPIFQKVKPNEILTYTTKSKVLAMVVSSPYYKTDTIYRSLENAPTYPDYETIELKPDDYAIMLNYYSKKSDVDVNKKRERLNNLISDDALIYQVFDNETYGVEILDKERYITLMTTPTTSLKNLQMINTKMSKGKIVMIKFRITNNKN